MSIGSNPALTAAALVAAVFSSALPAPAAPGAGASTQTAAGGFRSPGALQPVHVHVPGAQAAPDRKLRRWKDYRRFANVKNLPSCYDLSPDPAAVAIVGDQPYEYPAGCWSWWQNPIWIP